jgi:quinoprotein glucose dehydrogenase
LLTETLLIVGQEGGTHREGGGPEMVPNFEISDPKLCAYDKATGKLVGEVALLRNATGAPMTYMLNGKQFIVLPTGAPICRRNLSRFAYDELRGLHPWLNALQSATEE